MHARVGDRGDVERKNIDISSAGDNNKPVRRKVALQWAEGEVGKSASHSFNPVNWWKSVICYLLLEKQCDERALNRKRIITHWERLSMAKYFFEGY